jgi:hypothetical protein
LAHPFARAGEHRVAVLGELTGCLGRACRQLFVVDVDDADLTAEGLREPHRPDEAVPPRVAAVEGDDRFLEEAGL